MGYIRVYGKKSQCNWGLLGVSTFSTKQCDRAYVVSGMAQKAARFAGPENTSWCLERSDLELGVPKIPS